MRAELVRLDQINTELVELYGESATAFIAYRKTWLTTWTDLVQRQGQSATAAKTWADAKAINFLHEWENVKATVLGLQEERDFIRFQIQHDHDG